MNLKRNTFGWAVLGLLGFAGIAGAQDAPSAIDTGDTAWMLIATGLVLLMLPGLAMFYGGLARTKNVVGTMMHTFVCMAIVGVMWAIFGYALFAGDSIGGWIGWDPDLLFLKGVEGGVEGSIPTYVFVAFQCMFAIITPALISGACAERVYFRGWCLFVFLWVLLVYIPLAHWIWNGGGWLFEMGVVDLAGGLVIHVSAGISALVLALLLGKRIGHPQNTVFPNNLVMTLIGAGLLWMGWFGFNGGSILGIGGQEAARVVANTLFSACAGALVWLVIEGVIFRKGSGLGFASGVLAGLVVITPAAQVVDPLGALIMGAISSGACYVALQAKDKLGYDDSLDCFGIHGVGSGIGVLLLVIFATHGDIVPTWKAQLVGMGATIVLAGVMTVVIYYIVTFTVGFRLPAAKEKAGMDSTLHGEQGYGFLNLN